MDAVEDAFSCPVQYAVGRMTRTERPRARIHHHNTSQTLRLALVSVTMSVQVTHPQVTNFALHDGAQLNVLW
jgi:hypothetical protein